jgi:hypothetical protein
MQIVPKSTTNTTSMAKLDPTRSADAWAAFRLASDEHSEKRHETIMKRKRDKLEFELFTKRQHVLVEHSMLDETARIGRYKRHIGEKQLDLDQRRHAFERQVLADNSTEHARAAEIAHADAENLHAIYLERQKAQTDLKTLLDQDRVLLNQRAALLDDVGQDRPINDVEQFLRGYLGARKDTCSKARHGQNGFANGFHRLSVPMRDHDLTR